MAEGLFAPRDSGWNKVGAGESQFYRLQPPHQQQDPSARESRLGLGVPGSLS